MKELIHQAQINCYLWQMMHKKEGVITSTAAIKALTRPVPVSIDPKRVSPILQEIICAPGATPLSRGSCLRTSR
jgi:hypothetical protein